MVADILIQVSMGSVAHMVDQKKELVKDVQWLSWLGVRLEEYSKGVFMVFHNSELSLVVDVKSKIHLDPLLIELKESVFRKNNELFSHGEYSVLRYQERLSVPNVDGLREKTKEEAHGARYSIHLGDTNMNNDCVTFIGGME